MKGLDARPSLVSHRSAIIPTGTSLGIPAVFWLRLYGFAEWAVASQGVDR